MADWIQWDEIKDRTYEEVEYYYRDGRISQDL